MEQQVIPSPVSEFVTDETYPVLSIPRSLTFLIDFLADETQLLNINPSNSLVASDFLTGDSHLMENIHSNPLVKSDFRTSDPHLTENIHSNPLVKSDFLTGDPHLMENIPSNPLVKSDFLTGDPHLMENIPRNSLLDGDFLTGDSHLMENIPSNPLVKSDFLTSDPHFTENFHSIPLIESDFQTDYSSLIENIPSTSLSPSFESLNKIYLYRPDDNNWVDLKEYLPLKSPTQKVPVISMDILDFCCKLGNLKSHRLDGKLKILHINRAKELPVSFSLNDIVWDTYPTLFVKAYLQFKESEFKSSPVTICPNHRSIDDPSNKAHDNNDNCFCNDTKFACHVLRTTDDHSCFKYDKDNQIHYLQFPITKLEMCDFQKNLQFTCYSTCQGFKGKKLQVKFVLEDDKHQELAYQIFDINICSKPNRAPKRASTARPEDSPAKIRKVMQPGEPKDVSLFKYVVLSRKKTKETNYVFLENENLKMLFTKRDTLVPFGFKIKRSLWESHPTLYLKAVLNFSDVVFRTQTVKRCPNDLFREDPTNRAHDKDDKCHCYLYNFPCHIMQTLEPIQSVYVYDAERKEHYLRFLINSGELEDDYIKKCFKFTCLSSCKGIDKRELDINFILQDQNGKEIACCKAGVKICSKPIRDSRAYL